MSSALKFARCRLQHTASHCNTLACNVLTAICTATHATHYITPQHTATHCNTPQHRLYSRMSSSLWFARRVACGAARRVLTIPIKLIHKMDRHFKKKDWMSLEEAIISMRIRWVSVRVETTLKKAVKLERAMVVEPEKDSARACSCRRIHKKEQRCDGNLIISSMSRSQGRQVAISHLVTARRGCCRVSRGFLPSYSSSCIAASCTCTICYILGSLQNRGRLHITCDIPDHQRVRVQLLHQLHPRLIVCLASFLWFP